VLELKQARSFDKTLSFRLCSLWGYRSNLWKLKKNAAAAASAERPAKRRSPTGLELAVALPPPRFLSHGRLGGDALQAALDGVGASFDLSRASCFLRQTHAVALATRAGAYAPNARVNLLNMSRMHRLLVRHPRSAKALAGARL
jgi:hypothetical protein